jgi:hypothetical protein
MGGICGRPKSFGAAHSLARWPHRFCRHRMPPEGRRKCKKLDGLAYAFSSALSLNCCRCAHLFDPKSTLREFDIRYFPTSEKAKEIL